MKLVHKDPPKRDKSRVDAKWWRLVLSWQRPLPRSV